MDILIFNRETYETSITKKNICPKHVEQPVQKNISSTNTQYTDVIEQKIIAYPSPEAPFCLGKKNTREIKSSRFLIL